jgi:anti-sigma regulatory factor (Ser/Thr protein kinase)
VPGLRSRLVLPGEERQLRTVRRWLAALLSDCPARDDVTTVATELATNSIKFSASGRGGWFAVEIAWHEPVVRVTVADGGGPTEPRVIDNPSGEHGRGLLLVRGLSVRTGVCGDHRGRLVWADVRWDGPGQARQPAPGGPHEAAIRDDEAALASRFAGVPAWFGRSTLQWWALAGSELLAAPSAQELTGLLDRVLPSPTRSRAVGDPACADVTAARVSSRGQRPDAAVPWYPLGHSSPPQSGGEATTPRGPDARRMPPGIRGRTPGPGRPAGQRLRPAGCAQ